MRLFATVRANLAKFATKAYRDGFLQAQVEGGIAFQIQALRHKFGLSQEQFAQKTGKKQSVISRLENPETGPPSVQTLLDIAQANDVALVVRFVSYPEFLDQTADMSPRALQPETIHESLEQSRRPIAVGGITNIWKPQSQAAPRWVSQMAEAQRAPNDTLETASLGGQSRRQSGQPRRVGLV